MDLSTAIRLGAERRRQYSGSMFGRCLGSPEVGSCAMGAAYEALTGTPLKPLIDVINTPQERTYAEATALLRASFPQLSEFVACPVSHECVRFMDKQKRRTMVIIEHLNDVHDWTREAIADWLEGGTLWTTIDRPKPFDIGSCGELSGCVTTDDGSSPSD